MDGMKPNFGEAGMHGDLVCALFAPFFPKHPNKANATHDPPTQPHALRYIKAMGCLSSPLPPGRSVRRC